MEGGGAVIVSSLNVLPNNDLLAIAFARQDQAAGWESGHPASSSSLAGSRGQRPDMGNRRSWFSTRRRMAVERRPIPPSSSRAGKVIVIVPMCGPPQPPFEYGDTRLWQVTSTDNAVTWSKPAEIHIPRARPCVSGRPGVVLSDGTILVPYWWDFMFQTGAKGMARSAISRASAAR